MNHATAACTLPRRKRRFHDVARSSWSPSPLGRVAPRPRRRLTRVVHALAGGAALRHRRLGLTPGEGARVDRVRHSSPLRALPRGRVPSGCLFAALRVTDGSRVCGSATGGRVSDERGERSYTKSVSPVASPHGRRVVGARAPGRGGRQLVDGDTGARCGAHFLVFLFHQPAHNRL